MKKIILLAIVIATTFGCTKNVSKTPVNSQTTYSISNSVNDTIPEPKKKGVCEGCSHQ